MPHYKHLYTVKNKTFLSFFCLDVVFVGNLAYTLPMPQHPVAVFLELVNEKTCRHFPCHVHWHFPCIRPSLWVGAMKQIATALVKAQKAFGPALKTSTNPHFRSRYADLSACVEAVIDALNDNGIAMIQVLHECNDGVIVSTTFVHESGEVIDCGKLHVPAAKQDPQGYGSALTYARRYSLMAAAGIAPEDDDGNAASRKREVVPPSEPNVNHIEERLAFMATCATKDELKLAYTQAYASCDGNQIYQAKVIAVKNKRLKELQNV
jgi:hypothetical protein